MQLPLELAEDRCQTVRPQGSAGNSPLRLEGPLSPGAFLPGDVISHHADDCNERCPVRHFQEWQALVPAGLFQALREHSVDNLCGEAKTSDAMIHQPPHVLLIAAADCPRRSWRRRNGLRRGPAPDVHGELGTVRQKELPCVQEGGGVLKVRTVHPVDGLIKPGCSQVRNNQPELQGAAAEEDIQAWRHGNPLDRKTSNSLAVIVQRYTPEPPCQTG